MNVALDAAGRPICGDCGGYAPERHGGFQLGNSLEQRRFVFHVCSVCGAKTGMTYSEGRKFGIGMESFIRRIPDVPGS